MKKKKKVVKKKKFAMRKYALSNGDWYGATPTKEFIPNGIKKAK